MFKLSTDPTFTHPVTAKMPVDGGYIEQKFSATFRILPDDETKDFDITTREGGQGLLRKVVARVDDIVDDADKPIPYSDQLRDRLIAHPIVRQAMADAYFSALAGAPLGN